MCFGMRSRHVSVFSGTAWTDPEFVADTPHPLGLAPQQLVTYLLCLTLLVVVVAW